MTQEREAAGPTPSTTDQPDLEALIDRLRQGRLVYPAREILVDGFGYVSTGETREIAHPDAIAAADAIEHLRAIIAGEGERREAAVLFERERCARIAEDRMPAVQCMSVEPIVAACEDIAAYIRSENKK